DLAGGTGFPAGTWSFSIKTQIPSANLVAGTAILAIGIWKGTVNNNGTFKSKQTILAPTDDPAAQNIRSATSRTTTVSVSVPAFTLASTERLYVEIWRKQVGGIGSSTAADREVDLVANDGGSQIAHPPSDDTPPVNAFSLAASTGGVYLANPGGATSTLYYRGSAAGSFRLGDAAADTGSGVQQVTYPAVATAGWTHSADTITAGPTYTSSTYSWTAGATTSPGAQAVAAQDKALNPSTGSPVTITNDTTAPTAPSVALTSPPPWYTNPSVALTPTDGTDAASGLDTTSRVYQRDEAALRAGTCATFPNTWSTTVANPDTTVQSGKCYRYRLLESDRVGNQSAPSAASATAKVDRQGPTQPSLAFTGTSATGSTLYYAPSVSGSFTVTASGSTDAESGLSGYVFPTAASWTVTGTGATRTYAWTPASTQPGTLGVHGVDLAGNSGPDASFTPTPDAAPPTTTDNTATVGSGWKTSTATVTLTAADALSGVRTTYYTTDGSTPTTSSPQGTTITLAADGVYTIKYFSVDNVGNAEAVRTASTQIRVDATPPTVTMGALPAAIHSGQVLTASASDGASGVASVDYSYCTPSPCTPSTPIGSSSAGPSYSFTWTTQPPDGTYDVLARATDSAGNAAASTKQTVTISNTPPDTTITTHPVDPSNDPAPILRFTSSDPTATFECKLDAAAYAACTSPTTLNGIADGPHTFSVRSINAAGPDATPATWTWTEDTAAPDTTITASPPNPSLSSSAAFSFTSSETGSSFQCKLDGGAYTACTSPTTVTGLLDGSHTFSVRATDAAGNTDPTPATFTWTSDSGPPDTTITSRPTDPSADASPSFSFSSSEAGSSFQCKLDSGAYATCTSPQALSGLADGSHTFSVAAIDAVNNVDPTPATYTWTVDTTPPDTTITAQPPNPSAVSTASFSFTSTDAGASFQCQLDGATYATCTPPQTYNALVNGTHTFAVRSVDALGNTDATPAVASWNVNVPFVPVDEVHYTFTGPTSVAFDWRGTATDIRYGPTTDYGSTATGHTPSPLPFSSAGPFREADLTGLSPGTTYHYSIGGGNDVTFTTEPTSSYTFDVIADVGAASHYPAAPTVHSQVASDNPAFVLVPGDISYADPNGQSVVDEHFNDVMTWSRRAAYMPAWGNHEWQTATNDDLRNYKGRFEIPNAGTSPDAPSAGCCGEDWGWFDAGPVRFISYPEKYTSATWSTWQSQVDAIFAAAQNNPSIKFIVTFGHRPAYSTGLHGGETQLANILDGFGTKYSKYVLNINGHSHDYERYQPISGVTHITTGASTSLEPPWVSGDARTVVRAMHLEHLRIAVSSTGMRVDAICGPSTPSDDITCDQGSELDSYTIGTNPPPAPTLPSVLYVDNTNPFCSNTGIGSATQPYCTIGAAATRVSPGQTVEVGGATYPEMVNVVRSGTATARITFTAAPGTTPTLTGGTDGFLVSGQSYVTIEGFTVTGTTGDGIVVKNASNVLVSGNHVTANGQQVLNQTARGIRFETVTDSIVEQNTVDHNTSYGIYITGASGAIGPDVNSTRNLIRG
ncbi:MAG: OmpL47-type beta-barrel domain-containing protein, partial [Chloroflexota bacterium]